MPDWLMQKDNYKAVSDKDNFINKSILGILKLLSRIRIRSNAASDKLITNTYLKFILTILIVILTATTRNIIFVFTADVYLLVLLSMMKDTEIISILKTSAAIVAFTLVILIPAAFYGNYYSIKMITLKVLTSVTFINILMHSERWDKITNAFKIFHIPDIFILVMDIAIKYIVLLGEFALSMLYSLRLRSVGKNNGKNAALSGIVGTMFIKSREMADDMHTAMKCRGFTGEYYISTKFKLSYIDIIHIILNLGIVYAYFYLRG